MRIKLSDHFTYGRLLRFTLPSVIMMAFTQLYAIVDGIIVSNYVGKTAFAAINLIMPVLVIVGAIGFMLGAGGVAVVSITLGQHDNHKANRYFSFFVLITVVLGAATTLIGFVLMPWTVRVLGAEGQLYDFAVLYGRIFVLGMVFYMLQFLFQTFLIVAEKPKLGLYLTIFAGITNFVLDLLFIAHMQMGIAGAALATIIGQMVGGVIPLIYFSSRNSSLLKFVKPLCEFRTLIRAMINGLSEFLNSVSYSVITIMYNMKLIELVGENGIAAYGAIVYVGYMFVGALSGYATGCVPLIGYNYGNKNRTELKSLFKKSICINAVVGIMMTGIMYVFAEPISNIFVGYDTVLLEMTVLGMQLYSFCFITYGTNVFASALFTALDNGLVSGAISLLHVLVFQALSIMLLPAFLGLEGVWLAVDAAEAASIISTVIIIRICWKRYF